MTEAEYLEWYRRLSPTERRHAAWENIAKIETALMVEFLADDRPHWRDATWVRNVPRGPDRRGFAAVQAYQKKYGSSHVTTGNAVPLSWDEVGIYVRTDAVESTPNPLREYLSRRDS